MAEENQPPTSFGGASFATTHWTVVLQARECGEALEKLCRDYWRPLYAFLRRRGHDHHAAKDLTQAFFVTLLERNDFALIDPRKGKFRTFLLVSMKHFVANQADIAKAKKRGGDVFHILLDSIASEAVADLEPAGDLTPDMEFDRQWALSVLDTVLRKLENECCAAGKGCWFARLQPFLLGDKTGVTYADLADELALSESAIKITIHRCDSAIANCTTTKLRAQSRRRPRLKPSCGS
jgi:RNA polymerase sigma factor (sigma-70 family)